jgi:hypothetical protein
VRGGRCSVCDGTEWFIANDGKAMSFLSFAASDNPRIDVFGVCCSNCGYMRFHAADVVNNSGPGSPTTNDPA